MTVRAACLPASFPVSLLRNTPGPLVFLPDCAVVRCAVLCWSVLRNAVLLVGWCAEDRLKLLGVDGAVMELNLVYDEAQGAYVLKATIRQ
jgi:hypothetical protein